MKQKHIPIAIPIIEDSLPGANGTIFLNSRIKTFYVINGVGKWYHGIITEIINNNCRISYDEGFEVIGSANCVFLENNNIARVQLIKKNKTKKCLPFLGL